MFSDAPLYILLHPDPLLGVGVDGGGVAAASVMSAAGAEGLSEGGEVVVALVEAPAGGNTDWLSRKGTWTSAPAVAVSPEQQKKRKEAGTGDPNNLDDALLVPNVTTFSINGRSLDGFHMK